MSARRVGLWLGLANIAAVLLLPASAGMAPTAWRSPNCSYGGVVMSEAVPLAAFTISRVQRLADWLGQALLPLSAVPLPVVALGVVAMMVLITEFASNVATASGIMPVVASLIAALGADPLLLAIPAAMAASWGVMLPAGTGPNAIAWATGRIALPRIVGAGLLLDLAGIFLLVGSVWALTALLTVGAAALPPAEESPCPTRSTAPRRAASPSRRSRGSAGAISSRRR